MHRSVITLSITLVLVVGCGDDGAATEGATETGGSTSAGTDASASTSETAGTDASATETGGSTSAGTSAGTTASTTTASTSSTSDGTTSDGTTSASTTTAGTTTDATTGGTGGLDELVDADLWEAMFPERDDLFAYDALIAAAADFPAFAGEGSLEIRRRELAAFLANIGHETTGGWPDAPGGPYAWGLYFTQEVGCEMGQCAGYCDPNNAMYPCAPGKTYHGRGPIQLSWNYNYGLCGDALGEDLLSDPDLVTSDGAIAFKTGLWFWMTPQSPKPSAHDVMTGAWQPTADDQAKGRLPGFGMTVNIINGGLECGQPTPPAVMDRLGFYDRFVTMLMTSPGDNLSCEAMQPYF